MTFWPRKSQIRATDEQNTNYTKAVKKYVDPKKVEEVTSRAANKSKKESRRKENKSGKAPASSLKKKKN